MPNSFQPLIQIMRKPPEAAAAERPAASPSTVEWPAVAERLRQYAAARDPTPSSAERCELCGANIEPEHGHLVNVPARTLLCVCRPCSLLFTHDGAGGARFRAVPQRYELLSGLDAARESWESFQIPIGLAFFFRNSTTGRTTAFYPSPAGATESELPLDSWDALVRAVPQLSTLAADVEAVLVRRSDAGVSDALIVPIDACYELVGRIRRAWRGFHGGDEVWREIDGFFMRATERARGATSA
jgi:Family of unknown function (DUF5947)